MPAEPKRRKLLIILGLVGIVLLAVILSSLPGNHGPMQNGKSLDEWLMVCNKGRLPFEPINTEPAQAAIKALGTNAVLHLVRRIGEGKQSTGLFSWLVNRVSLLHKIEGLHAWANGESRQALADGAVEAFWCLGPAGESAVGELTRMANPTNSTMTAHRAIRALGGIGTTNCLPPLIAAMTNSDTHIRATAACSLHNLRGSALPAVPLLIASLQHSNERLATCAASTLGWLKLEPELVVPALTKGLEDSRPNVRMVVIVSLGQMGPLARPAIPDLLQLTNSSDQRTRDDARNAIRQIAPEALTNTPAF